MVYVSHSLIQTDFFVLSGDLVTDVYIHYLADIHRSNDATVSMVLRASEAKAATDQNNRRSVDIR